MHILFNTLNNLWEILQIREIVGKFFGKLWKKTISPLFDEGKLVCGCYNSTGLNYYHAVAEVGALAGCLMTAYGLPMDFVFP